ncbi:MAG: RNA methyltransferase [Gammaproteobacteria bacterium]|nr:RNA methyltransferase [Gammaproteobacteria bacterium]
MAIFKFGCIGCPVAIASPQLYRSRPDDERWRRKVSALDRFSIVLVGTTHPGNIGAAARAMKTMGLTRLKLVNPAHFPSAEATARASGADDVLARCEVFDSLADALADVRWAVATTARDRELQWPQYTPRRFAEHSFAELPGVDVAVVFGRESSGLSNDELNLCNAALRIPANPQYSSLNLAMAVQLVAYELSQNAPTQAAPPASVDPLATQIELGRLNEHLLSVMAQVGYYDPERPKMLVKRLRRMLAKAGLTTSEVRILRGLLTAVSARNES